MASRWAVVVAAGQGLVDGLGGGSGFQRPASRTTGLTSSQDHGPETESGSTLVEALLAAVIVGVLLVLAAQGFADSVRTAKQARDETRLATLVDDLSARAAGGEFGYEQPAEGTFEEDGFPQWTWTVEPAADEAVPNLVKFSIAIVKTDAAADAPPLARWERWIVRDPTRSGTR